MKDNAKSIWETFYLVNGRIPSLKEFKEMCNCSDKTYYRLKNLFVEPPKIKIDIKQMTKAAKYWK